MKKKIFVVKTHDNLKDCDVIKEFVWVICAEIKNIKKNNLSVI